VSAANFKVVVCLALALVAATPASKAQSQILTPNVPLTFGYVGCNVTLQFGWYGNAYAQLLVARTPEGRCSAFSSTVNVPGSYAQVGAYDRGGSNPPIAEGTWYRALREGSFEGAAFSVVAQGASGVTCRLDLGLDPRGGVVAKESKVIPASDGVVRTCPMPL
jgi:hypothetical protein